MLGGQFNSPLNKAAEMVSLEGGEGKQKQKDSKLE
jgi:hypothetical protein